MDISEIEYMLPSECIDDIATIGSNDEACEVWADRLVIPCSRSELVEMIESYGAGDEVVFDSDTDKELWAYVLWIAAHNVKENRGIEE